MHKDDLEKAFSRGFDAFIHLAAWKAVGESMEFPEKYSENNITGTLNIINAAPPSGDIYLDTEGDIQQVEQIHH
jgi:UDP-glucose 4-epimerase